ncbi:MAG: pyridoxal 5'-phosphate synthase glutaminase subunit PdxT, partial [Acidobacteria bacterium]|nr:pyridoxal 5'-phosphate synthase glutaminase subunit PdxT [Acidobacteriota bacterium]NIQ86212.1 pyridoxal 5'-phosphate synthase glutaminase subunit PdxT [Acidobacteriota bacterium]
DFEAHSEAYAALGVRTVEVRRSDRLRDIDGLVMPGGESTTLLKLMEDEPWFEALREFHEAGKALFATCAGVILLARE